MPSRKPASARYIVPLNMNKLEGRLLRYPAKGKPNEILLVGDLGADLEYWWGLIKALHDLGSVTMPDLPGIGGMDSFFKISKRPSIDNYADYLASFIKMRYRRRKFIAAGIGFGFVVLTRTLQRYPELRTNVKLVISFGGYADHDDFVLPQLNYLTFLMAGALFSRRLPSYIFGRIGLNANLLNWLFNRRLSGSVAAKDLNAVVSSSVRRISSGDPRTLMNLIYELARFTNCEDRVDLPLTHVGVPVKHLDWRRNEQHLRIVYSDFIYLRAGSKNNRYPVRQDKRTAAVYLPQDLKSQLRKV